MTHRAPPVIFQHTDPILRGEALAWRVTSLVLSAWGQVQCLSGGNLGKASQAPSPHMHPGMETNLLPQRSRKPTQGHHTDLCTSQNPEKGVGRKTRQCQWDKLGG